MRMRVVLAAGLLLAGCGRDRADRAYFEALEGEEKGMEREQQVALMDLAIQLSPRRAYYYETRAGYRIDLKQYDRAIADLDRAIELVDRPYARFLRGMAWCQIAEYRRSLADFDSAIVRQPFNSQFYRGRSLARAAVGDVVGALADADRLVAGEPQRGESYFVRGVARTLLGRDRDAIADFNRAATIRPELVYVVEERMRAYQRIGDSIGAQLDEETAARLREEQSGCAPCLDPFRY